MARIIAELKITLNDKGEISVGGCIDQVMLAYGMLECAKAAVKDRSDAAQKGPQIERPTMNDAALFGSKS